MMKTKSTFPAPNIPSSPPSVPGGRHWPTLVLPDDRHCDKVGLNKPVIRWMSVKDDASVAGFTIADLEIDGPQVEPFIRETMGHVTEPGTVGD